MDAAHDVFEELRAKASHADPGDARQFGGSGGKANGTTNLDELLKQALIEKLNGYAWAELEIPPEEKLLGDLVVPGSRTFLVGTTGLGKTLFGYELVGGMISGKGLLDWKCDRASRWLIVDGEMPTALIKRRIGEVLNRHNPPAENIIIYSLGRAEELASVIPGLDEMPPLNTPEGHEWVMRLVELLEPDGILFDNLMSLAPGDHADGETWRNTEPLVMRLSRAGIAQIWLDHTGWNTDRQYGTSTKAWKFDAVGVMKPLPETERVEREVGFTLAFEAPGKCRRRTPENWRDFQTRTIRLAAGEWRAEAADKASKPLTKEGEGWYRDLVNMFAVEGLPQKSEPIDWRRCTSRHIRPSGAASPDRMPDAMLTGTAEARNGGA